MSRLALLWRTINYLKMRQIAYQIWNRLRTRPRLRLQAQIRKTCFIKVFESDNPVSWQDDTFMFLNQCVSFSDSINWNYDENGKLWTYHLNYFDFLNQRGLLPKEGLRLMHNFMNQTNSLRDGLEPYPTSLRIGNWVQFLSRHQIQNDRINAHLYAQVQLLTTRLEYHLEGNHLLENGFALLTGALFFRHQRWLQQSTKLIRSELTKQILPDGCHEERSPVYQQILLNRLLTILWALQNNTWYEDSSFSGFLSQKAALMLDWLNEISFQNGDVPMVNDAALGIAPTTAQLLKKADLLKINPSEKDSRQSACSGNYRMFRRHYYELFVDAGPVGADHQPGHAHADTFSFVLYVNNRPIIVDSGTSTYQPGYRRNWERSTAAHNTVEVNQTNSSEVWASFRVGRRARVTVVHDTETTLTARHDGYGHLGVLHQRTWSVDSSTLTIIDQLLSADRTRLADLSGTARLHFHPSINVQINRNVVVAGSTRLTFNSETKPNFQVISYSMAEGFNRMRTGQCLEISFMNRLETTLTFLNEDFIPNLLL